MLGDTLTPCLPRNMVRYPVYCCFMQQSRDFQQELTIEVSPFSCIIKIVITIRHCNYTKILQMEINVKLKMYIRNVLDSFRSFHGIS